MRRNNPGDPKPEGAAPDETDFDQQAVDWFIRLQASEGNPETARTFRSWLDRDGRNVAAFEKVTAMWGAPEFSLAASNVVKQTGLDTTPPKVRRRRSLARKAAAGGAAILLALGITWGPNIALRLRADYVTAVGEQRTISLPDGSSMTLNTETAVALDFSGGRRDVRLLEGEAYFDVQHDPAHPFTVTAQFGEVRVRGTAFDVKSEVDADSVVLSRGFVAVTRLAQPSEHASLVAGEAVSVTGSTILPVEKVDPAQSLAWLEGRISFANRPLGRVLNDLRRYYRGRVFVTDRQIEEVAVSGNYRLNQPDVAIRSLAEAAGASVTTLPGGIILVH